MIAEICSTVTRFQCDSAKRTEGVRLVKSANAVERLRNFAVNLCGVAHGVVRILQQRMEPIATLVVDFGSTFCLLITSANICYCIRGCVTWANYLQEIGSRHVIAQMHTRARSYYVLVCIRVGIWRMLLITYVNVCLCVRACACLCTKPLRLTKAGRSD